MNEQRWIDPEGAAWPITGDTCTVCGLPLIPVDDSTMHPLCEIPPIQKARSDIDVE